MPKFVNWLGWSVAQMPFSRRVAHKIRQRNLTFLSRKKFRRLRQALFVASRCKTSGSYLEAGVALGGTAIFIAHMRPRGRPLYLFDVFEMIPPPDERDANDAHERYAEIVSGNSKGLGDDVYYGYRPDLKQQVLGNLAEFGLDPRLDKIELIEGLFEKTMTLEEPVQFAHIDCDWYSSVKTCIERVWPALVPGGVLVFDDYQSYEGCKRAVDEFLRDRDADILFSEPSFAVIKR